MSEIITVKNLKKSYGDVRAVKGIDFYVEKGKLFAFLGPNGAGKSTTIDMICTFLRPDDGEIIVDGHMLGKDDHEIRKKIGAVFQDNLLDDRLTVLENLKVRGSLYGLRGKRLNSAALKAAEAVGITDILKRQYGKISGGQRRRADIARALINSPDIMFLDEPTTGLDPQTRKTVWETVTRLQAESNMTVFLTTHYMEEAANADYVIVIDNGLIAAKGTPSELREKYTSDKLSLICPEPSAVEGYLKQRGLSYTVSADRVTVSLSDSMQSIPIIEDCKGLISGLEVIAGTMDDAFIAITGKEIRE